MQALLSSETQKYKETLQVYVAEQAKNEELSRKLEVSEMKEDQFEETLQRFEMELSY